VQAGSVGVHRGSSLAVSRISASRPRLPAASLLSLERPSEILQMYRRGRGLTHPLCFHPTSCRTSYNEISSSEIVGSRAFWSRRYPHFVDIEDRTAACRRTDCNVSLRSGSVLNNTGTVWRRRATRLAGQSRTHPVEPRWAHLLAGAATPAALSSGRSRRLRRTTGSSLSSSDPRTIRVPSCGSSYTLRKNAATSRVHDLDQNAGPSLTPNTFQPTGSFKIVNHRRHRPRITPEYGSQMERGDVPEMSASARTFAYGLERRFTVKLRSTRCHYQ
jgi:hypothetical protein